MDYKTYLASDRWRQLKAAKEKRTPKRCSICEATERIDCHHLFYRNLFDVKIGDLRWLCRRCHDVAHDLLRAGRVKQSKKNRGNPQSLYLLTFNLVKRELKRRAESEV